MEDCDFVRATSSWFSSVAVTCLCTFGCVICPIRGPVVMGSSYWSVYLSLQLKFVDFYHWNVHSLRLKVSWKFYLCKQPPNNHFLRKTYDKENQYLVVFPITIQYPWNSLFGGCFEVESYKVEFLACCCSVDLKEDNWWSKVMTFHFSHSWDIGWGKRISSQATENRTWKISS